MSTKENKGAKSVLEAEQVPQVQPLLQIDPLPKRQGTSKARRDILIHPEIYPEPVVETAVRLIDPRDFEVSWNLEKSIGHIRVHISAKSYEHDAEELEYYFYRKLILASTAHHSQQTHSEIQRLFMQTAHNVTRQTWQALGWNDTFALPSTKAKEVATVAETSPPCVYRNISYIIDDTSQRLFLYAGDFGLPDVLAAASEMRRAGWEVTVDARVAPIQVAVTLKDDDIMSGVMQFHNALNAVDTSVFVPVVSSKNSDTEPIHGQIADLGIQEVDIKVYPQIFSLPTIQLAALSVLSRFHIKIDGDPTQQIQVSLRPKSDVDTDGVEDVFHEALIQASLDEYKLAYYAPIRSYFLKLALSFGAELEGSPLSSCFRTYDSKGQELNYRIWINNSEIHMSVSEDESALVRLFALAQKLKSKGIFVFEPGGTNKIRVKIRPRIGIHLDILKEALNYELQKNHAFLLA